MDLRKQLGLNVSRLRHKAKLTQDELCEAAGIDRSYLQRIEAGTMNPTVEVLYRLITALKSSWEDILRDMGHAEAQGKPPEPAVLPIPLIPLAPEPEIVTFYQSAIPPEEAPPEKNTDEDEEDDDEQKN